MRVVIGLVMLVWVAGCSSVEVVRTQVAEGFRLSGYETFDFFQLEASGDTAANFAENVGLLKEAITRELESRGMERVSASPDLLVNIGIVVEEKVQTRETTIREAPIYIGQRRYHWETEEVEVGRYREGTVTLDLVDRRENKLVWEGVVEGVIPKKEEQLRGRIDEGVEALFEEL